MKSLGGKNEQICLGSAGRNQCIGGRIQKMKTIRLDKFLADAGLGTRSQVKELVRKGKIKINNAAAKKPEEKVDPEKDTVTYLDEAVGFSEFHYYMLNKPAGVVSATEDRECKTVLDLLEGVPHKELFPVGRLDKDTEGLLLITDDGALAHELLSPKKHVDKTYFVRADGIVTDQDRKTLCEGVDIGEEKPTMPAEAEILKTDSESGTTELLLTIREGKFHQVKRMLEAVGKPVIFLKRIRMGSLILDETLKQGEFRELTSEEIGKLKERKDS